MARRRRKLIWFTGPFVAFCVMIGVLCATLIPQNINNAECLDLAVDTEAYTKYQEEKALQELVAKQATATNGIIYLTFDDGPSEHTGRLLDVLAKYNVKATFFVTCNGDDAMILREYNEGHEVALHTCSHNYARVYTSVNAFFSDLEAVRQRVLNITGYSANLMRFPGGSSNTVSRRYDGGIRIMSRLVREVENRGYVYFDWNDSSGDAGGASSTEEVYTNVINALKWGAETVVLQHDVKGFSVDAVESIIQYGLNNGFRFEKLTASSFTAHHGVNN